MGRAVAALVIFAVAGADALLAQYSEQYTSCTNSAKTQTAMHKCAKEELQRADGELNDIYQKLLSAARNRSAAIGKIKAAERAWIAYRDAYIGAMYSASHKQAAYGSIFPMEADLSRVKLARQQIDVLKDLLTQYGASQN